MIIKGDHNLNRVDLHKVAYPFIKGYLDEEWPEDHWVGINGEVDLNFWLHEDNNGTQWKVCTLYDVEDGVTQTCHWVTLFSELDWPLEEYIRNCRSKIK